MSEELFQANSHGIFPYPDESKGSFLHRIMQRKKLEQDREAILQKAYGDKPYKILDDCIWEKTNQSINRQFDVKFIWPLSTFSNAGLRFYEAGATFFFEGNLILQMKKKKIFSSLQEEVLLHEAIHIARQDLKSKKYEEFFAYSLSKSRFRKTIGPLFRSPKETLLFAFIYLSMPISFYFFDLSLQWTLLYVAPVLLFCTRLGIYRKRLSKCLQKLEQVFGKNAGKVLFRLTDEEIGLFANKSPAFLRNYVTSGNLLRWKQLLSCYEMI